MCTLRAHTYIHTHTYYIILPNDDTEAPVRLTPFVCVSFRVQHKQHLVLYTYIYTHTYININTEDRYKFIDIHKRTDGRIDR